MKMLNNVLVVELCRDLVGANIGLRLSHLGATVTHVIEHKSQDSEFDENSFEFLQHYSRRRGKNSAIVCSFADLEALLATADVFVYNSNDPLLRKLSVSEGALRENFPNLILAEYSTYGSHTVWADRDEGDLVAQYRSGITLLSGDRDDGAVPMGLTISEAFCAGYLTCAVEAALYRRGESGVGCKVSSSLLESLMAIQFEYLTTSLNSDSKVPDRAVKGGALSYLSAPYGVYETLDGYFAMSVVPIPKLAEMMGVDLPNKYVSRSVWYECRDEIMALFVPKFLTKTNQEWLELFQVEDIWCSPINTLSEILSHEGYRVLDLERIYKLPNGGEYIATRCPYSVECDDIDEAYICRSKSINSDRPLDGLIVVDLSQYLSGPSSTLHLADLGATVIKVERSGGGDAGHNIIYGDVYLDGDSSSSLSINRNKYGLALDLKDPKDKEGLIELIKQADILVHNFRPAAMSRLGLDYQHVKAYNKRIIYAEVSGYGDSGCWKNKPGQDFILQAISGISMLSGDKGHSPIALGLPVVDMYAGVHIVEGVLAALYNRDRCGAGAHIKVTMLGSVMDLQSDAILAHYWGRNEEKSVSEVDDLEPWSWDDLFGSELGESLDMLQNVVRGDGYKYVTTRCPIRIDGQILRYDMGAPCVGEHTEQLLNRYLKGID